MLTPLFCIHAMVLAIHAFFVHADFSTSVRSSSPLLPGLCTPVTLPSPSPAPVVCGGMLFSVSGTISSPNFPSFYTNNLVCTWSITAVIGHVISLNFTAFTLEYCCDYVTIRNSNGTIIARINGRTGLNQVYTSTGRVMFVSFTTDGSHVRSGFQAFWRSIIQPSIIPVPLLSLLVLDSSTPVPSHSTVPSNFSAPVPSHSTVSSDSSAPVPSHSTVPSNSSAPVPSPSTVPSGPSTPVTLPSPSPAPESFPQIEANPTVTPGVKNKRLEFRCEFKSVDKDQNSRFEVTWYQGSPAVKIAQTDMLRGGERVASLQNANKFPNNPLFYLGTTISCRVRSWFSYSANKSSSYKESNHYFAGILVEPRQLRFTTTEAGKPLKLTVKATVPVVCEANKACSVLVDLGQDNTQNFLDLCTVVFKTGPANQTKTVEVYAKRDFINDGDRMMVLKVDVLEHIDPVDWNQHKKVPNIQILAVDFGTAQCSSSGDPHLTTFDKLYYNHYQVGDYVLVNSSCRQFEVHIRTWRCSRVSCNCGIAVREGDDVVVVDMCRDRIPRARFASTSEPAAGTSIRRDNNGKSFIITFPSGAFVRIDTYHWFGNWYFANLVVQIASDDYKCTSGLCGTFDGDRSNDMIDKNGKVYRSLDRYGIAPAGFAESWKLPVGSSLFYYKGGKPKCDAKRAKYFCTCQELCCGKRVVDCNFKTIADRPKYVQGFKGWKNLNFPGGKHCGRRKRRSTPNDIVLPEDNDVTDYIYDPAPILKVTIPDWPTESGKTLNGVTSYCSDAVKNSAPGLICKSIPDFDFNPFIGQCIEDIQITDNYTFSGSAIRTMQGACEETFLTNTSFWQSDPEKNNSVGPPLAIANTLCPNLCSGNGLCVNATCVCNSSYTSADCSIEKNKGPTVQSIPLNGLCDVRKRADCLKTRINGYDFLDSDKLLCRSTQVKISDKPYGDPKRHGAIIDVTRGYLLSFAETMCELKSHPVKIKGDAKNSTGVPYAGYLLDVTNDGKIYSAKAPLYLIYDSKCMSCKTDTGACALKSGSCIINGYCFNNGELHSSDSCSICDPSRNQNAFSIASGIKCADGKKTNKEMKKSNVVVIVCSVLGVLVAVAVVALIIMKVKKNSARAIVRGSSAIAEPNKFVNAAFDRPPNIE